MSCHQLSIWKVIREAFVNSDYLRNQDLHDGADRAEWMGGRMEPAEMVIVELTVGAVHIAAPAMSYRALMPHVIV